MKRKGESRMMRLGLGTHRVRLHGAVSVLALACVALAGCADSRKVSRGFSPSKYGVAASKRVIQPGQPVPKGGGAYIVGRPYVVAGRTYVPRENRRYRTEGVASWYGDDFHGRLTANGEIYDMHAISAAHPTMPMPSYARVTNLSNGRSLIVRVNDRGPYHNDRVIDLSSRAAELLEMRRSGTGRVRVEYVGSAALEGSDDRRLAATLSNGRAAPPPSAVRVASSRPFVPVVPQPTRLAEHTPMPTIARIIESDATPLPRPGMAHEPALGRGLPPPPPVASFATEPPQTLTIGRGLY